MSKCSPRIHRSMVNPSLLSSLTLVNPCSKYGNAASPSGSISTTERMTSSMMPRSKNSEYIWDHQHIYAIFCHPVGICSCHCEVRSNPCSESFRYSSSSSIECTIVSSGNEKSPLVRTIFSRPGRMRPIDSNVLRPMTIGWPFVVWRKCAKSSGICHGIFHSFPMIRLRAIAAIAI